MLGKGVFKLKDVNKDIAKRFMASFKAAGIEFEEEYKKAGMFTFGASDFENATMYIFKVNGKAFFTINEKTVIFDTTMLTTEQDLAVTSILKQSGLLEKKSFVLGGILSLFHLGLVVVITLIGFSMNNPLLLVLGAGSFVFIMLGLALFYSSMSGNNRSLQDMSFSMLAFGMLLTMPSSVLHYFTIMAIRNNSLLKKLESTPATAYRFVAAPVPTAAVPARAAAVMPAAAPPLPPSAPGAPAVTPPAMPPSAAITSTLPSDTAEKKSNMPLIIGAIVVIGILIVGGLVLAVGSYYLFFADVDPYTTYTTPLEPPTPITPPSPDTVGPTPLVPDYSLPYPLPENKFEWAENLDCGNAYPKSDYTVNSCIDEFQDDLGSGYLSYTAWLNDHPEYSGMNYDGKRNRYADYLWVIKEEA